MKLPIVAAIAAVVTSTSVAHSAAVTLGDAYQQYVAINCAQTCVLNFAPLTGGKGLIVRRAFCERNFDGVWLETINANGKVVTKTSLYDLTAASEVLHGVGKGQDVRVTADARYYSDRQFACTIAGELR